MKFCELATSKKEPPTPESEPVPVDWITANIAWLAPCGSILIAMAGILFKYKEIIAFYQEDQATR